MKKKVVIFISLFERGDDENKVTAEKKFWYKFFIKNIIDSLVPTIMHTNTNFQTFFSAVTLFSSFIKKIDSFVIDFAA